MGSALFALYAPWASPEVGWEDSAFLQLCHATLGVPHGPGFPLYVLVGRLLAWPFGSASALGSNLLSAVAFAAAGVVLLEIVLLLESDRTRAQGDVPRGWTVVGALAVVAGWAALPIHLPQAARTEVYTFVLLCVLLSCYCALCSRLEVKAERAWRFACGTAWCWGLGMAVHPLIAVAGATPWLLYVMRRRRGQALLLSAFALLPMSLYLYPILRGRLEGVWAWGDFTTVPAMLDYFTRRSAWAAVVSTDGGWLENLAGWGFALPGILPLALWLPTAWGLWLVRKHWPFLLSPALVFVLVLWAAPYDPANLDLLGYFLPAVAIMAAGAGVLVGRGLSLLWTQMPGLSGTSRLALGFFLLGLAGSWPVASIVAAGDRGAACTGAGDVARILSASLPEGATLFVNEDSFFGVLEYETRTQGLRPDLRVISLGSLRYPFYRRALAGRLPSAWVAGWDARTWNEAEWNRQVRHLLAQQRPGDLWYSPYDRLPGLSVEKLRPHGFVAAFDESVGESDWEASLAFWKGRVQGRLKSGPERDAFARWIFNFGALALDRGFTATGWEAMHLALEESPKDPEMYYLLGRALERAGRLTESKALLGAAVEIAPYRERYRAAMSDLNPALAAQP